MSKGISKIYFFKAGDHVKIGTTNGSISDRVAGLQTGNPIKIELLGIMLGGTNVERKLHEKFSIFRRSGEWFFYSDEIKEFVNSFTVTSGYINESEEKNVGPETKEGCCCKDGIDELNLNIYQLKDALFHSIYGLAEIYRLYSKLQDKVPTNICPKLQGSIYDAFCDAAKNITRNDVRWARRFLINCEEYEHNELEKLAARTLEYMVKFNLRIKDT